MVPLKLEDRPVLVLGADQCKIGGVALNYLKTVLRAVVLYDPHHRLWNDAMQAIKNAGLWGIIAVLLPVINALRGPWMGGEFGRLLEEALGKVIEDASVRDPELADCLSGMANDMGLTEEQVEELGPG